MPVSNETQEFINYVVDLMQSIGPVVPKRMFGGHGIFLDGLMFGLIADGVLYLKADKDNKTKFTDRGLVAFKYSKKGKEYSMSYYQAPDEALEDSDVMNHWANNAYNTALKAATKNQK